MGLRIPGMVVLLPLLVLGCGPAPPPSQRPSEQHAQAAAPSRLLPAAASKSPPIAVRRVALGKNVWLEVEGSQRRLALEAEVCLRAGMLEQLLCRRATKEHEAILTADLDARDIHKGLLLAGARPGSPVRYQPAFQPPTGSVIKVTLRFQSGGRGMSIPAQRWIRDIRTKKELAYPWVFAGSQLLADPDDAGRPPVFTANSGDVICVSNFPDALLDLPINSSADNSALEFEAFTERIPPLETKVTVVLQPEKSVGAK